MGNEACLKAAINARAARARRNLDSEAKLFERLIDLGAANEGDMKKATEIDKRVIPANERAYEEYELLNTAIAERP